MAKVLLVAAPDLLEKLQETVLWRTSIERVIAPDCRGAFDLVRSDHPNVVVLDARDGESRGLIDRLRTDVGAREVSIAVILPLGAAQGTAAGWRANVLLREEQGPALWDDAFEDLLNVAPRRTARIPVRMTSGPRAQPDSSVLDAFAANISVRGVMIEAVAPLIVGSIWSLSLEVPGRTDPLRLVGKVVWQRPAPDGVHCGVEFLGFHGDALGVIGTFVTNPANDAF